MRGADLRQNFWGGSSQSSVSGILEPRSKGVVLCERTWMTGLTMSGLSLKVQSKLGGSAGMSPSTMPGGGDFGRTFRAIRPFAVLQKGVGNW